MATDKIRSGGIVKSVLLAITALATLVTSYVAYKNYVNQPKMIVAVFRVSGNEEVYYSSGTVDLKLKKESRTEGFINYELPLKTINEGEKDAEGITVWLRVEGGEIITPNWRSEQYAEKVWKIINIDRQSPHSGIKIYGAWFRVADGTKEISLFWRVHSFQAQPSNGSVVIPLE